MALKPINFLTSKAVYWGDFLQSWAKDCDLVKTGTQYLVFLCALNCIHNLNRVYFKGSAFRFSRGLYPLQGMISGAAVFIFWVWRSIIVKNCSIRDGVKKLLHSIEKASASDKMESTLKEELKEFSTATFNIMAIRLLFTFMEREQKELTEQSEKWKSCIGELNLLDRKWNNLNIKFEALFRAFCAALEAASKNKQLKNSETFKKFYETFKKFYEKWKDFDQKEESFWIQLQRVNALKDFYKILETFIKRFPFKNLKHLQTFKNLKNDLEKNIKELESLENIKSKIRKNFKKITQLPKKEKIPHGEVNKEAYIQYLAKNTNGINEQAEAVLSSIAGNNVTLSIPIRPPESTNRNSS